MRRAHSAGPRPDLIRIRVRPGTIHISRDRTVLAMRPDGIVAGDAGHGLFVDETRALSLWRYAIDGVAPHVNAISPLRQNAWLGYYLAAAPGVPPPPRDDGSGQVPPESRNSLELRVWRQIDRGLREEIALTNFAGAATSFVFAIEVDADFADIAESRERIQQGERTVRWDGQQLTFDYAAAHAGKRLQRSVAITVEGATASYVEGQLRFEVKLDPRQTWSCTIQVLDLWGAAVPAALHRGDRGSPKVESAPKVQPLSPPNVVSTLERARDDLDALRMNGTLAAGVPQYVALFGRDALTAGWQAAILGPELMTGSLEALGKLQGTRNDDWRDEQPGKMLHEAHTGPLSMLDYNPRGRSYSSITTSGLYAFIVAELWHWTGDKTLVRPFIEPALRALQWLEKHGDLDGDGFYEYQTRSPMGPKHQAWKDSPDAIVDEDGNEVDAPIATCEEQAFVYVAKLHLAETLWWLGERELSRRIFHESQELKKRFHDAFWMEDEGFYALALGPDKRQVRSIASNAGHCLAAAIAEAAIVPRVAERLFAKDLFSGWGIRTLSSDHPRYNPYSYHLGSIWPVEHGTFALGFWRYGLYDRVEQIARAQFDAAELFEYRRLPELFAGHPRDDDHPFPGFYPNSNPLQAWSSSSVFALLQAILGLYPYAPLKMLVVDPHLPEWLPEYTLRDLRVGKATVTIEFRRHSNGRTTYRVLGQRGKLHVVRQATPWSLTAQPAARLRDALSSLLP